MRRGERNKREGGKADRQTSPSADQPACLLKALFCLVFEPQQLAPKRGALSTHLARQGFQKRYSSASRIPVSIFYREPVSGHHHPMGPHAPGPPGGSSASAQGLSLVQQMVHAAKTRPDLTAEELADLVSVCPVTWQDDGQGNQLANWVSLPYSVIREVKKAIREFGLTSTYVHGLLEGLGTGYTLVPEDWKALLHMMLKPSQYVIWLSEYRQMAERQAQVYIAQGVTYEQLAGEGPFATVQIQSQLQQAVFPIISAGAQHAFQKVPDSGKPTKSFASIRQGVSESFMDFTNRLKRLSSDRWINLQQLRRSC
ncbi:unnamed protein product [Lepidochelys kempii]